MPSSEMLGAAMLMIDRPQEAEIPRGVVNRLVDPIATTYAPKFASRVVRKITLAGSTAVGRQMVRDAAATVERANVALAGNAPALVFDNADLDATLDPAVPTKFVNASQVCIPRERLYVHETRHDRFVVGFAARSLANHLANGFDEGSQMESLITARREQTLERIVADAERRGGRIEVGGRLPWIESNDFSLSPTVLAGLPDDATAEASFGGIKASSMEREGGGEGILDLLNVELAHVAAERGSE